MPRNSSGVMSLTSGYRAETGQLIEASQHNPPLEDIASEMTGSLPRNGSAGMLASLPMGANRITALAAGSASTDAVNKTQMEAAIAAAIAALPVAQVIPPGTIGMYAGATPPSGWVLALGQQISRTTFAALFAAIGTRYGVGDGSTTFNVPFVNGRFPRFADEGVGIDPARVLGSFQDQAVQSHAHAVNDPQHVHQYFDFGNYVAAIGNSPVGGGSPAAIDLERTSIAAATGITIAAFGGPETRPTNIAFLGIIKV